MPSRLKSFELHGYKTFASRTLFEFPGVITCVVGPNGSGKSNIAEFHSLGARGAVLFASAGPQDRRHDFLWIGAASTGWDGFSHDLFR